MGMTRRDALKGAGAAMVGMTGLGAATPLAAADPFGYLSHDALGLAALVRSRQVSASELLETAIGRAEDANQRIDFMAQKLYAHGRGAVANRLHDGLFCGVPFLIKDLNCHIEGTRSGQGSRLYNDYIAPQTSELVRRHQAAGLVIFGKTATPEFGLTGTTESIATGATRNPWNLAHSAGGSSGVFESLDTNQDGTVSEMERLADELPIEQVAKRWIVASDPDEAVEKVKFYTDAGLNHLVFHAPGHDQRRFLELFEKDLARRLRRLG